MTKAERVMKEVIEDLKKELAQVTKERDEARVLHEQLLGRKLDWSKMNESAFNEVEERLAEARAALLASQARELVLREKIVAIDKWTIHPKDKLYDPDFNSPGHREFIKDRCKEALETPAPDLKELVGKLIKALKCGCEDSTYCGVCQMQMDTLADTQAVREKLGLR